MQANKCVAGQGILEVYSFATIGCIARRGVTRKSQNRQTCYFDEIRVHRDQSCHVYVFYSRYLAF
jgi:hypothetical protein